MFTDIRHRVWLTLEEMDELFPFLSTLAASSELTINES